MNKIFRQDQKVKIITNHGSEFIGIVSTVSDDAVKIWETKPDGDIAKIWLGYDNIKLYRILEESGLVMEWISFKVRHPQVPMNILLWDVRDGTIKRASVTEPDAFITEDKKRYLHQHNMFFSHWWRIDDMVSPNSEEVKTWKEEKGL